MTVLLFVLGLVFGSFYNVVIYRVPNDLSIAKGRSMCPDCEHTLGPLDLVPVFSQLYLRGRCRYCKTKISLRYPCIEIVTGILFSLAYLINGLTAACLFHMVFWSMLLIVAMIDYDHMIISDGVLLVFVIFAVIYTVVGTAAGAGVSVWWDYLLGAVIGFGFYFIIYIVCLFIYKQEAFGLGDVYLMGVIGLYLGISKSILTALLSFFIAFVGIAIMKIIGKKLERKQELSFGPYICIAAFLASIFGDYIIRAYLSTF